MLKIVKDSTRDDIFSWLDDDVARELEALEIQAKELHWTLLVDTDSNEFGLMNDDALICQLPYLQSDGHKADRARATLTLLRNLIQLFSEQFQPMSKAREAFRRRSQELEDELLRETKSVEHLRNTLGETERQLHEAIDGRNAAERQLQDAADQIIVLQAQLDALRAKQSEPRAEVQGQTTLDLQAIMDSRQAELEKLQDPTHTAPQTDATI